MTDFVVKLDTEIVKVSKELGYSTPKSFIEDAAKLLQHAVKHFAVIPNDPLESLPTQMQNVINDAHDEGYSQGWDDNDSYHVGVKASG